MKLTLKRFVQTQTETLGKLYVNDSFQCYTLEDIARPEKVKGKTRIPTGKYIIEKRKVGGTVKKYRERFGEDHYMLWLQDVPNFLYILIHVGNYKEDTEGCILVGSGVNIREKNSYITYSVKAYLDLWKMVDYAFSDGQTVYIEIFDEV
jgi:hypothetical protein